MGELAADVLRLQARVLESVADGKDLKGCLDELCRVVEEMVPDSLCSAMLLDDESGVLKVAAAPHVDAHLVEAMNGLVPSDLAGSCGTAVHQGQPVYVTDTACDPRWESMREIADEFGIKACWSFPIFDRSGAVLGSFAISHPASREPSEFHQQTLRTSSQLAGIAIEHYRQESRLRASERRYQDLYENAPDMFLSVDAKCGEIIACNQTLAKALDRPKSEILGLSILEIYHPDCREQARELLHEFQMTGETASEDVRLCRRDGSTIDISLKVSAVRDEDGTILYSRSVLRDITERKRSEQAVQQAQKLESIGVLASGIAHDFNNLLIGILGNTHLALEDLPEDSPAREALSAIEKASQNAADLTRNLLAYAGRGHRKLEPLNLNTLAREMVDLLASAARTRMELSLSAKEPWITGDATQIRQVLMNLLMNAAEASRECRKPIQIRTGFQKLEPAQRGGGSVDGDLPPGDYACLEVIDAGTGMDRDTLQKIFDPFFTTKSTGRGLGLAATLGIVKSHRGMLRVTSKPGQGATFCLLCPTTAPEAGKVDTPPAPEAAAPTPGGTLMVVDDQDMVLDLVDLLLTRAGYEVLTASTGHEALATVEEHEELDAVILDMTLPDMAGRQVFDAMRAVRPDLPVLFCSGHMPEEFQSIVDETEQTWLLAKPFVPAELNATVRRMLSQPVATPTSPEVGGAV